jgi:Skp family chaperone for outer membrane proteins
MLGALVTVLPRIITQSLVAAGVSAIIGLSAYSYGFHKSHQQSSIEHAAQSLRASEAARTIERHWNAELQKAQHEAKIREEKIRADVDSVRAERDRLRKQLAANHSRLPAISHNTVIQYTATLGDIFEQCTKRLEEVARAADGHANDAFRLKTTAAITHRSIP